MEKDQREGVLDQFRRRVELERAENDPEIEEYIESHFLGVADPQARRLLVDVLAVRTASVFGGFIYIGNAEDGG